MTDRGALIHGDSLRLRVVVAVALALFIVAAAVGAWRKEVTRGFDERAHLSYVAELQERPHGVRLDQLRMLDAKTFKFTATPSYINHAAPYYRMLAVIGPRIEGNPNSLMAHRAINVAIGAAAMALMLATGLALARSTEEALIVTIALLGIPFAAGLAGSVNNDNLAFLGGALTLFGGQRFVAERKARDLAIAGIGLIIAGAAKLTALMLCGGFLGALLLAAAWLGWLRPRHVLIGAIALLLAVLPAFDLWLTYGSVAPETPGQTALLLSGAHRAGWDHQPRLAPLAYLGQFLRSFLAGWHPLLGQRSGLQSAMLALPLLTFALGIAGTALALRSLVRKTSDPLTIMVVAAAAATAATLGVHIGFSYQRHLATGWLMDAYPRYYLPLILLVPLATLVLLRQLTGRPAQLVAGFLLLSPIVFRLLG